MSILEASETGANSENPGAPKTGSLGGAGPRGCAAGPALPNPATPPPEAASTPLCAPHGGAASMVPARSS